MKSAQTHQVFTDGLARSTEGVQAVAHWLRRLGFQTHIPKHTVAKRHEDWQQHSDKGDLFIRKGPAGKTHRVEVKWLTTHFTPEHWPYPGTVIVDAQHKFDNADPKPYAYIILSDDKQSIGIIRVLTRAHWFIKQIKDRRMEDYTTPNWCVDPKHVEFRSIDDISETNMQWVMAYDGE